MEDCVDSEARDRIAKIWTELREHATDYWGPDKQNGKRSELVDIGERMTEVEKKIKHYEDTKESSCFGLKAIKEYIESKQEEEAEMRIEQVKGKTLIRMQWLQLVGMLAVALIALLK